VLHAPQVTIWLDHDAVVVPVDHPMFGIICDKNNVASQGEHNLTQCKRGDVKFWEGNIESWEGKKGVNEG